MNRFCRSDAAMPTDVRASRSSLIPIVEGLGKVRVLFAVLLLLLAGGCISDEREREIGDTMASEVNPHLPIIADPLVNAYLYTVGEQIATVSGRPRVDYRFYLVNSDVVNAFALPGGHVYLTRGLIERTDTGAEFAGVLAHEIGHVAARHGVQKLQRHLRTGSLVNVLYNTILGGEPELLRENSLQLANIVWTAGHSREDEREADRLAVQYLLDSNVDPDGIPSLLATLLEEEDGEDANQFGMLETWLSTHPLTTERIEAAERNIQRLGPDADPEIDLNLDAFPDFRSLVLSKAPPKPPEPSE